MCKRESESHYRKGEKLSKQGKYQEAIAEYEEAIRLYPSHEDARQSLTAAKALSGVTNFFKKLLS
ncbi:MAG: tetratricopeptide repeat protein [Trichodesmium sp. St16_bin4-tuft]|nr:tetratricopeptide repeat protein [Trichodesmium sp. St4_bin8_1]MDE5081235.1 tetratricopeptide repeat protein [Trichodesmium sp. St18_bin1]MDE5099069.1 tetratricopeptide repeat protein [Trichodesmium sp. St16_bin4-tuft]